ncbi:MAG: hypothetical protein LBL58_14480, partial [Tannerellaceae bacterium]|nr:hypothetical protein [Tannerellaceae bacterium]
MKTKLICLFLFSSLLAYSQGILSCEEDASKAAIYTDGDRNTIHAMVEIECSASIPLTFKSKRLGSLTPSVIENGVITNYRITVNRNRRFRKDELHITSPHYRTLIIPLESVKRKEKKHFWVYDPDMEIAYLNYEEDVSKVAVFIDGDENSMNAMVEIECSTSIPLTFSSKYFGRLLPDTVVI